MKILAVFIAFALSAYFSFAQPDTTALFRRFPEIPPFQLLKADSGWITKENLKKNRSVIIMYFSPDCHHCQHQVEEMLKRMDDLDQVQIVLATYRPMEEMIAFYEKYHLKEYSNILMGRDTKYFIQPFYRIRNLPYLALYDKKGNLITTYEGNVAVDRILESIR